MDIVNSRVDIKIGEEIRVTYDYIIKITLKKFNLKFIFYFLKERRYILE